MWRIILQVVIAPLGRLTFCETYFADIMTSFNKVASEGVNAACYLVSGDYFIDHQPGAPPPKSTLSPSCGPSSVSQRYIAPCVIVLPLWFRLLQCLRAYYNTDSRWPHIPNAIKYGFGMAVVIFGIFNPFYLTETISPNVLIPYRAVWLSLFFATTLYTWIWDVKMDWALLSLQSKGEAQRHPPLLRDRLIFKRHLGLYYVAILVDLVCRYLWTTTLLPPSTHHHGFVWKIQSRWSLWLTGIELARRSMWSWFRLEVQQIRMDDALRLEDEKRMAQLDGDGHNPDGGLDSPVGFSRARAQRAGRLEQLRANLDRLIKACSGGAATTRSRQRKVKGRRDGPKLGDDDEANDSSSGEEAETDDDLSGDEEEDEDTDSQGVVNEGVASKRGTLIEVLVILLVFVVLAALAGMKWV